MEKTCRPAMHILMRNRKKKHFICNHDKEVAWISRPMDHHFLYSKLRVHLTVLFDCQLGNITKMNLCLRLQLTESLVNVGK